MSTVQPKGRTVRWMSWLLGSQIALAALLVGIDLAPKLPGMLSPGSTAPKLDQPIRPGDQTRLFRPDRTRTPAPGIGPDMPRRLMAASVTVDGATGLSLRGAIEPGDAERLLPQLRDENPAFVTLDSPGGSVSDALALGRAVRDIGAETRLESGTGCYSACPYIFAGGVTRVIADGAQLGVHQHSFGESTILPAFLAVEDIQRGQADVLDHLVEMGIDLQIMGPALATPADEIYVLSSEELSDWNVVTAE